MLKILKIVTYQDTMQKLYIMSTFSFLHFRNTVFCGLKLKFRPEIGGSYQIKIFLMSKRVFNTLRIVTYQDRMPKLYIVSTFFILVTIFWWVFKEKVLSGQKLEVAT